MKRCLLDQIQIAHESGPALRIGKELERPHGLANLAFMHHHHIVPEVVELQALQRRDDLLLVLRFLEDANVRTNCGNSALIVERL